MQGIAGERNKMKRDQLQKDARKWISPPDPSKNYNIACDTYQSGTGVWFFQGDVFTEWSSKGTLLWIHGKPGSGKTLLLSSIIRNIDRLCATGLALMAYYYFDFRDTDKQHRRGLLSSLLCQLCAESDPCYEILAHLYSNHGGGTRKPSEGALTRCLMDMLQLEGLPAIYIIVDALDECPNTSGMPTPREKVLEFMEELIDSQVPNVHICVTSRPEFDIRSVLEPLTPFRVSLHDESGQKKDILDYISTVVNSDRTMRKWRAQEKQLVIDTLSERAGGMFRWVFCQLETLRHCFPAAIRQTLDTLPETLDETYEQILLTIRKAKRNSAYHLFQCLVVANRPLRVDELAEVLAIRFDPGQSAEYSTDWRPEDSHEAVLSACSSLITVVDVDGSQAVQFSHFSVKEFLTSDRLASAGPDLSRYHILPQLAHTLLAQTCLSILLQLNDSVDKDSIKNRPLVFYAAQHWVDHIKSGNVSSNILDDMERLFDADKPNFATWVWLYDTDYPFKLHVSTTRPEKPKATPLYYAVLCGFRDLVQRLLGIRPEDVNSIGGYYRFPLHAALSKGHIEVALLLLQNGADINALDQDTMTPLRRAIRSGRIDIVQLLLEHHADVNLPDESHKTPLWQASSEGEVDIARVLLQNGADAEFRDEEGRTAMNMASENGHLEVVRLLLDHGVQVDTRDNDGYTSLKTASEWGYPDLVRLLIDRGADVNSRDNDYWTPLHEASHFGFLDIVQQLLDHGANVNLRDNNGETPFHRTLKDDHLEVARLFLAHGVEVDILSGGRRTPLAVASVYGHVKFLRYLIEQGANVNSSDDEGWTSLHSASRHGHLDAVRLLLDNGANVDSQRADFWTPLHLASSNGHVKIAELLVERGADVNQQTDVRETPLDRASSNGRLDVTRFLIKCGSNVRSRDSEGRTPLHAAARAGHLDVVTLLLESGADIDVRNRNDESPFNLALGNAKQDVASFLAERMGLALPETVAQSKPTDVVEPPPEDTPDNAEEMTLHVASKGGHLDVVRKLLDGGEHVDARNATFDTPLDVASQEGKLEVVRLLIDRGADVNSRDWEGWTPLLEATWNGHLDVVRLLLERGADIDALDQELWTSLHMASKNGHLEVARLLLEHGADVNVINEDGRTPAREAMARGHRDITRLLSNHDAREL